MAMPTSGKEGRVGVSFSSGGCWVENMEQPGWESWPLFHVTLNEPGTLPGLSLKSVKWAGQYQPDRLTRKPR